MPRRGQRRKKTRTHVIENEGAQSALLSNRALKVPRSAVIRKGKMESEVIDLVSDLRKLMLPYTALHLKEDAKNRKMKLSDYATKLGGPMGVTHLLSMTQNASRINLRIARTPSGPTLTFRVGRFTLAGQVASSQRRPFAAPGLFDHPPVVVTNNFGDGTATTPPHVKLMRITFQNLFPAIDVSTVNLADCRRVVLFNLMKCPKEDRRGLGDDDGEQKAVGEEEGKHELGGNSDGDILEIRHYAIRASPVGVNRKVRKLVQANVPNLGGLDDIADYFLGGASGGGRGAALSSGASVGTASDSEAEDETSHVVLPQRYHGRGNSQNQKSALRLIELGPRLRLALIKIERGLAAGDVMYHAYVKKSPEEAREQKRRVEEAQQLKKRRREEQESNVAAKKRAREEKKEAKIARREERERKAIEALRKGIYEQERSGSNSASDGDEDKDGSESKTSDEGNGEREHSSK